MARQWSWMKEETPVKGQEVVWVDSHGDEVEGRYEGVVKAVMPCDEPMSRFSLINGDPWIGKVGFWRSQDESREPQ